MALFVCLGVFALHSSAPILARSWPQLSLSPVGIFEEPVHITGAGDGSGRLFIVEITGKIRIVRNGAVLSTPFLDMTPLLDCGDGRKRLLSLAFPPGYSGLGHFYVKYLDKSCNIVVARFRTTGNPDIADINSRQIIISQPVGVGLFGGPLYFGPIDGYLYVSFGDGSITDSAPGNAAQDPTTLLGKILRIDVETNNPATYSIPPTNPYAGTPGYRPEIWASGFRNPWRFSFDRQTGDLYVGDVGSTGYEEVDFQPANSPGGEDYGWKTMEAGHCFGSLTCNTTGLVLPVVEYGHTLGNCSITGGSVYRGSSSPDLQGIYLYGDWCSGRIWGARRTPTGWETAELAQPPIQAVTFGEDDDGNVYVGDYNAGGVYRLDSTPSPNTPPQVSVTAPTGGSVVNVGAAVPLRATASDPGGSVARVDFYVDTQLVASDATSPYEVTWTAGPAGAHSVTAVAVDNLTASTTSAAVPVSVVAVPTGTRVNVALAASGATASASSTINVNYGPSAAIDGRRSGAVRGQLGSWEDATAATPDWLQVTFAAPATIDLVNVFSLQVNSSSPVEPTPTLTSYIAVEDFSVQYWNGAAWVLIPGSQVVGNNLVWRPVAFSPVTTTAIRIVVTKVYGNNTRLTEVEAWSPAGAPRPTATLSAAPATITLGGSSTLSWTTSGATSVSIDQGIGTMAATGAQLVAPTATTTYTLTATNSAGATTSTAVVTVQAAPPANTPPIVGLTAPTGGSVVTVATPVALRATASDPGGSVARVEFYVDGLLVASDASSPYEATWTAVSVGAHSVTAIAVDNLNATTSSATVPVTVVAAPTGTRVNVALAANGATASASSMANANYGPSAAIDGRRSGAGRGQLGSWEDAPASTPDWLQVTFAAPRTIDLVNVFSLQVNSSTPVEPTPTLTSYIAVEDFSVQYLDRRRLGADPRQSGGRQQSRVAAGGVLAGHDDCHSNRRHQGLREQHPADGSRSLDGRGRGATKRDAQRVASDHHLGRVVDAVVDDVRRHERGDRPGSWGGRSHRHTARRPDGHHHLHADGHQCGWVHHQHRRRHGERRAAHQRPADRKSDGADQR